MVKAYLGLGSNLGDRAGTLRSARREITRAFPGARFSNIYETEPVELADQPWFLNQASEIGTDLTPAALLEWVRALERQHDRRRTVPKGPRTLDVDILLYGEAAFRADGLAVPHPGLLKRRFVLLPLSELAHDMVVPGSSMTVGDALKRLSDEAHVRPFDGGTATC